MKEKWEIEKASAFAIPWSVSAPWSVGAPGAQDTQGRGAGGDICR